MWGGFFFFFFYSVQSTEANEMKRLLRVRPHQQSPPPKKRISPVFELLPATFFSPLGKNADRSLCDWKLCGNNASVPLRVLSRNTRSILFGFQRAKKSKKPPSVSQQQNETPPIGGSEVLQADEYIKGLLLWTVQCFSCCFNAACPVFFLLSVPSVEQEVSCWILRPWMAQRPRWKG